MMRTAGQGRGAGPRRKRQGRPADVRSALGRHHRVRGIPHFSARSTRSHNSPRAVPATDKCSLGGSASTRQASRSSRWATTSTCLTLSRSRTSSTRTSSLPTSSTLRPSLLRPSRRASHPLPPQSDAAPSRHRTIPSRSTRCTLLHSTSRHSPHPATGGTSSTTSPPRMTSSCPSPDKRSPSRTRARLPVVARARHLASLRPAAAPQVVGAARVPVGGGHGVRDGVRVGRVGSGQEARGVRRQPGLHGLRAQGHVL